MSRPIVFNARAFNARANGGRALRSTVKFQRESIWARIARWLDQPVFG